MINIIDEYTDFILDEFCFYGKKMMEKYYISSIFSEFVKEYLLIRYYNVYQNKKTMDDTINYYLNEKVKQLLEKYPKKTKNIYFMADIFRYIIVLDNDIEATMVNKIENELGKIKEKYDLNKQIEFSKEYREFRRRKKEFKKSYETNDFLIETTKTKYKKVFDTVLKHNIKMPELYSEKAINDIYNSGVTAQDKLFVHYNLVGITILNEVINYDYETNYLVEFNIELFNKKDKLNRLLNIIDNDITKEKITLKISYTSFNEKREDIFKLINSGYNFAIIKDENYKEDSYISLFKFILDKEV